MAGTNLYWGHGENALRELAEAAGIPVFLNGLARGCLPADHPNFFSRARSAALEGRRRRAGDRRADGLPARLRRLVRRGDRDRRDRPRRARARPPARGGRRVLRRHRRDAGRAGRRRRRRHGRVARPPARRRDREARGRARAAHRRPRAAAPDAHLRRARRDARPQRDRHRRRRRLRLLRRPRRRLLRAGLLARPRPVRLPGQRARATRWPRSWRIRTGRSSCCSATAPSASPGWSSTRSPATASTSSA